MGRGRKMVMITLRTGMLFQDQQSMSKSMSNSTKSGRHVKTELNEVGFQAFGFETFLRFLI